MAASIVYALWGVGFGIALSAPVGPINILCLRRALFGRAIDGFLIGLGAAAGDTFYAGLAAFGLKAVFLLIESHVTALKIVGGIIMFVFAVRIWRSHPHLSKKPQTGGVKRGMLGAFLVTMTNPGVFLGFLALYALAGFGSPSDGSLSFDTAVYLVVGVFVGAALWWAMLAWGAQIFSEKINDQLLVNINHISAAIIALFAIGTLVSALIS